MGLMVTSTSSMWLKWQSLWHWQKNDLVRKFEEAERMDQGRSHLRKTQINRVIGSETALMYDLTEVVAAFKIQHQFRKMREIRSRKEESHDGVQILRAPPAG